MLVQLPEEWIGSSEAYHLILASKAKMPVEMENELFKQVSAVRQVDEDGDTAMVDREEHKVDTDPSVQQSRERRRSVSNEFRGASQSPTGSVPDSFVRVLLSKWCHFLSSQQPSTDVRLRPTAVIHAARQRTPRQPADGSYFNCC